MEHGTRVNVRDAGAGTVEKVETRFVAARGYTRSAQGGTYSRFVTVKLDSGETVERPKRDVKEADPVADVVVDTTCQICARAIKANRGPIAHHGYERPGWGYQTPSCFGAGWKPYEVARDALPRAIEALKNEMSLLADTVKRLTTDPPEEMVEWSYDGSRRKGTHARPEGYTYDPTNGGNPYIPRRGYDACVHSAITRDESKRRGIPVTISELQARFDAWVDPNAKTETAEVETPKATLARDVSRDECSVHKCSEPADFAGSTRTKTGTVQVRHFCTKHAGQYAKLHKIEVP